MQIPADLQNSYDFVRSTFKNIKGEPFEMTAGQCQLFELIALRLYPRNHIMTYTQYGKSDIVAMAILTRAHLFPEPWAVLAPTKEKTKIIMGYVIQHCFDSPIIIAKLEIKEGESLERIRRERSKNKLTFKIGRNAFGEIGIFSAQATRITEVENALMGYGSPNLVQDESALIPDRIHSTAMRMLGGHKDNFLVKVGNPFRRNHFLRSSRDPNYHQLVVDYHQGIREGRITQEFINEMKKEAMFDILYECKFPDVDAVDEQGYMPLITERELEAAMVEVEMYHFGQKRIGADVAGGGKNYSVLVSRSRNYAEINYRDRNPDTMDLVGRTLRLRQSLLREPRTMPGSAPQVEVYIDRIGIGKGAYDRLTEQVPNIIGVVGGEPAQNKNEFFNRRAENYWRLREWILTGGKLKKDDAWYALLDIRYKVASDRRIKIIPKEDMIKLAIDSPDVPDALANTFTFPELEPALKDQTGPAEIEEKDFDPYQQ